MTDVKKVEAASWEAMHPFGYPGPFVYIYGDEVTLDGNFTMPMLERLLEEMKTQQNLRELSP